MRDHPVIWNMMHTGYPDGKTPEQYICPVCGAYDISDVYIGGGEILGCENCVRVKESYEIDWDAYA